MGNLTNNVTVTGPRGTSKTVNCTVYPVPLVDISVNITSDKPAYFVDDVAVFTITVSNAENASDATNITLSELVPEQFEFMHSSDDVAYNNETGIWYIPELANGTSVTLEIYAHAKTSASNITNEVNASCDEKEWNYTNNRANVTVDIIAFHKPVKTVSNSTPYYHEYVDYTMTVENLGSYDYTSEFTVIDTLPAGLEFYETLSITGATNVSEVRNGQNITWVLTDIKAKSNATIVVRVKVNAVGNLTNNLTVIGPRNTTDVVNCTINPMTLVDLTVNITSDKVEYFVDDVAVWTITVYNAANGTNASNINLSGLLPDEFKYIEHIAPNGTAYNATTGVWTIPGLANGTNITLVIHAEANVPGDGIDYPVNVSCSDKEWNYTNNNDTRTVDIIDFHKPEKSVSNSTPYYHEYVNYTLTVNNMGNHMYTSNFTVIDSLPAGLEFIKTLSITGAKNVSEVQDGQVITWILTDIPARSNATIVVMVKVNDIGNLTNNLTVIGPRNAIDMDNCTITPMPIVDLSVNITSDKDEYFVDDVAVWTVTISNAANGTNASNVSLKDIFSSDNFELISCTDSEGNTYNVTDDEWIIPLIGNGTSITFTIEALAVIPGNDIVGTADVNCTEKEWNYTNNNASKAVSIVSLPKPVKEVSNHTPYYHEEIEYNLTVVNVASGNYTDNLTVIDSLPADLEFIRTVDVIGAVKVDEKRNGQVITWILTNVTKGSATITVRVKVNGIGNLTNNLTVVGPKGNSTTVNCTINPMPLVDISVNITSDKDEYFVDDIAVWTIIVSNAANATNASNINLSGLLPDEFEYMHCDLPNGTVYNETTGIWTIPGLANGTNVTLVIYADAHAPGYNIVYPANATCAEDEWDYTNNDDEKVVDIIAFHKPDKEVSNSTPYYHEYVNYTLTVNNMGNFMYTSNFIVIDSLPEGLEFVETLSITGAKKISEVQDGQVITWVLTDIPARSNATIVILVKVNAVGDLTNNLTVVGPRNAVDVVNCTITPMTLVDISVNITSDKDEYFVDDVAVWTVTVSNAANATNASDIELSELLPDEFEYMYCDLPNGTVYNETTGIWTIPGLANGTNVTLVIYAHAKVPEIGIVNEVNASCSDKEWNYSNNRDDVVVDIISFHRPAKIVSNSTPYYHEYVTYTLTVENMGNNKYTSEFDVIDSLPVGLEFIRTLNITGADKIREARDGQVVSWALTNISARSNATIVILVKVNAIGDLTNNLTVIGPRGATDVVNCTINPIPIVDISVNITSDKDEYFVDDVAVWTITVSNAANGTNASDIELSELLPDEFEYMYCDLPNGTVYNETTGVWTIPGLANGTDITLVIYAHAKVPADGITNEVNATCAEDEWNYTNNDDEKTVDIISFHRPAKIVSNSTPYYHEYVTYTLTVENMGNNKYTSEFDVIDSLPVGLEFIRTLNITGADKIREARDGQVVSWALTNISARSNATIVILVKVNAIGDLTNNLTVIGPRGATDMVNCTITPMPIVDLSVDVASDKDEYFVDDVAVWTITISNAANGTNASNVSLKDLLPEEFEFIDCTLPNGTSYNETTGVWTIGDLANGTNLTLTITSRAVTPAKDIVNEVNATCSEDEWNYDNNEADKNVTIVDLPYPVKTVDNSTPYYHDTVEYNLTIVNTGTNAYADNLTVIDSLPEGLQFIETVGIKGAAFVGKESVDGQTVTWIITDIAQGKATITVRVKVNALGELTNNLTVVGPNGTDKTVNCTVNPKPIVDLSVDVASDKDEYFVDDIAVWTITISNAANGTNATGVSLKDLLPPEFEFIDCTLPDGTSYDETTGVWTIGDLANGTSLTLTITSRALTPAKDIVNTVNATCGEDEWNYANNEANKTVSISSLPYPVKTVDNSTPDYHDTVVYNLTIVNTAAMTYSNNLTVIDSLPSGLQFIETVGIKGAEFVGKETVNGQVITWTITGIADTATIAVKVKVNAVGNLTNNLTIVGPEGTSATVNCTITAVPVVDISVNITADKKEYFIDDDAVLIIKVSNSPESSNATHVSLNHVIPSEFELVNFTVSNGTFDSANKVWYIGDLENGTEVYLVAFLKAKAAGVDIDNVVIVKCDEKELNYTNNMDNDPVVVVPLPAIKKSVNTTRTYNHRFVEYYLTVNNTGINDYTKKLLVIDDLPDGLVFSGTISIEGADLIKENAEGQNISWIITNISAKSVSVITLKVFVNGTGDLVNNLTIIDEHGDNDTVNCTIISDPVADLEITKTVSTTIPHKNDIIIWTITVKNNGPNTAVNTRVTDRLPSEVVYDSDDLNCYDSKSGIWTIGDLASGESITIHIKTKVVKTNTTITNFADVESDTYDPNETNNRCNSSTEVPPEADLSVSVMPDISEVKVGDKVIITITVKNDGPDTAENTRASIKVPKELEVLGYEPSQGTYDPETGTWDIGDVPPGEEVTLILTARAIADGKVIVEASVTCDTYESDLSNNNASAEISILPEDETPAEGHELPKMHATGNPVAMVLLALLAVAGISIRRKI